MPHETPPSENQYQFTDPRDGHIYKTVTIGSQTWMAENLGYLPEVNQPTESSGTQATYYVYDYNGSSVSAAKATESYKIYGVLYNWPAAVKSCPSGWHLPSDEEWTTLEEYLIAKGYNYDGTTSGNKIAKALANKFFWEDAEECKEGDIAYSLNKNNSSGFSAPPGGWVWLLNGVVNFDDAGYDGYWWSSTQIDDSRIQDRSLWFDSPDLFNGGEGSTKNRGLSVRCVKNYLCQRKMEFDSIG